MDRTRYGRWRAMRLPLRTRTHAVPGRGEKKLSISAIHTGSETVFGETAVTMSARVASAITGAPARIAFAYPFGLITCPVEAALGTLLGTCLCVCQCERRCAPSERACTQ